jgi:two-component system response regulator FlrC
MSQIEHGRFLTADPKMFRILQVAKNIANSRASVMLYGESGTGKEMLARFIHENSSRSTRRMFVVNCSAVPEAQLELELFGMESNGFSVNQSQKQGAFELAHDSTLLIKDVDLLPLHLQAKVLRVLQEGEVERVGSKQARKVNVRLLASTRTNIGELVKQAKFREDLFYRLNIIPVEIPSLRNRPKDVDLLAKHFVAVHCLMNGKPQIDISEEALAKLRMWTWPGNVRELENMVERVVLLTNTSIILPEHLNDPVPKATNSDAGLKAGMTIQEAERKLILTTLDYTNQNRTKAAKMLGISIRTLRNKLNEYREVHAL